MKLVKRISKQVAVKVLLLISVIALILHVLILTGVIPFQYVWGGRLETEDQMFKFEAVSLIINLFVVGVVASVGGFIKPILPPKVLRVFLWVFAVLFGLNTIGNIVSLNSIEAIIATPITLIAAIMFFRLAID